MSLRHGLWLASMLVAISGCAGKEPPARDPTVEARRVRDGQEMEEAKRAAPQIFAQGDHEVSLAQASVSEGDETAGAIHGETAEALFYRARVQARLARADADRMDAERALADASSQRDAYAKTRAELLRTSDDLDVKLRVAREKAFPAPSGPASPERARARVLAARSLAEEARLLCTAARIVGSAGKDVAPITEGDGAASKDDLTQAEAEISAIEQDLAAAPSSSSTSTNASTSASKTTRVEPLDRAARVRVRCLSALEHARKEDAMAGSKNDALLASLGSAGFRPTRTEQGVAVTLTDAFDGAKLSSDGQKKLGDLGRVARQESVAIELVLHDATEPSAREATTDGARANLAADALAQSGVTRTNISVLLAGAKLPLFAPEDAARRAKNARLDVIFVR